MPSHDSLPAAIQESNADQAIKALTAALAPKAKAIRNGKPEVVDATQLVPGDIVIIRLGEIVPADIKLMGETGEEDHPMQARAPAVHSKSCRVMPTASLPLLPRVVASHSAYVLLTWAAAGHRGPQQGPCSRLNASICNAAAQAAITSDLCRSG